MASYVSYARFNYVDLSAMRYYMHLCLVAIVSSSIGSQAEAQAELSV